MTPSTPVCAIMSRQACGENRSPLPSTVRLPACCFEFAEKFPAARSDITLCDGAAMDGNGRDAAMEGAVEDSVEVVATGRSVVQSAAHFDGDGNLRRHGLAHPGDDLQRRVDLAQQIATTAAPSTFLTGQPKLMSITSKPAATNRFAAGAKSSGLAPHQIPPRRDALRQ